MRNFEELKQLGLAKASENRYEEAVEFFKQALQLEPQSFDVNNFLGIIYFKLGDHNNSANYLIEAYKLRPDHRDTVLNLVNILTQIDLKDKAYMICEAYANSHPEDKEVADIFAQLKKERQPQVAYGTEKNPEGLNILFLQNSPCIRNYKYATALGKKGHNVSLAYTDIKLSQRYKNLDDNTYKENIKIESYKHLWDISKNYDLIHSHNEPDLYTVAAFGGSVPVIHDTHDLISLRDQDANLSYFEGLANRGADGRIYSTPYQRDEAKGLYGVEGPSLIYYNYASEDHLPKKFLPKLSQRDGKLHFVYEGGIYVKNGRHRDFSDQFVVLADKGFCVHIYPDNYFPDVAQFFSQHPNIFYNHPIPPHELIETMTQFDFGIIPWNLQKGNVRFLSSTIANKLFEYMAAGLPVATADITSYKDYFSANPTGLTFSSIDDLVTKIPKLEEIRRTVDFSKEIYTYESEIDKVIEFYKQIIANGKKSKGTTIPVSGEAKQTVTKTVKKTITPKGKPLTEYPQFEKNFRMLESWLTDNGWDGYDPYDIQDYFIQRQKQGKALSEIEKQEFLARNDADPVGLRNELNIPKRRNPKGLGLLLQANAIMYKVTENPAYLTEAKKLAEWLINNPSPGYKGLCWGYPFDWQSIIFIPQNTPSVVVSSTVGGGLWELYEITRDAKYLEACVSICNYITLDLNIDEMEDDTLCFSYTPIDNYHVHNANLFAAEFLAKVGKEIDNHDWMLMAERAGMYAVAEQQAEGNIFYWGYVQKENGQYNDHYHTGFEIRCLFSLYQTLGKYEFDEAYRNYLQYYANYFVNNQGRPTHFPTNYNNPNVNIHGAAESVLMACTVAREIPQFFDEAKKTLEWTIKHLQTDEGWFGYSWNEDKKVFAPFLRWGQAWMLRAFAEFFRYERISTGEWGYYEKHSEQIGVKADYYKSKTTEDLLADLSELASKYLMLAGELPPVIREEAEKIVGRKISDKELQEIVEGSKPEETFVVEEEVTDTSVYSDTPMDIDEPPVESYKDYQIAMPSQNNLKYGSKEWTENLFRQAKSDPWGQDWRASQKIRYVKALELINKYIDTKKIGSVLDVGCSLGYFTKQLNNKFVNARVTGTDISSEAVNKCSHLHKDINFINSSLPFLNETGNEKYDFISALEVICYVDKNQLETALTKLHEKINTGGYLLISIYMNQPPFHTPDNFKVFVGSKFEIVEAIERHHLEFYKFEQPLREILESFYHLTKVRDWKATPVMEKYLQAGFELLGNTDFLEEMNDVTASMNNDKTVSHSIILARKVD